MSASPGWLARWARQRAPSASGCRGCGRCCEFFGANLSATRGDMARWRAERRQDLLSRVNRLGWLWVDPGSGRGLSRCPFLQRVEPQRARCRIHHTKPDMCRSYPTLAHARRCVGGVVFG